jgi:glycosyltransferase involved in cell wall biosynthesis
MKIAMMVRGYLTVPGPADVIYAPIDLAAAIAEGLVRRGHEVDFFAPLGSHVVGASVETMNLRPLATNEPEFRRLINDPGLLGHIQPSLWDNIMGDEMFRRAALGRYDLLHFHHAEIALPHVRHNLKTPVVYTVHDPLSQWYKELFELYDSPNQHFISISNNQRRDAPDLRYARTVYNGVDLDFFPFSAEAEDYLLIAGRIVPEKGYKEAIELAQRTDHRLLIIGPVYSDQQGYFDQYIKPHLSEKILYLGAMEKSQLVRYYQKAKAFVTPIQWEEPFGLTTIEAMACGTPVITLHRGAAPEIVQNRKTGYVVGSMAEMAAAVKKIDKISRAACRLHVEKHFSTDRMVDEYEATFQKIVAGNKLGRLQRKVSGTAYKATKPLKQPVKKVRRTVKKAGS